MISSRTLAYTLLALLQKPHSEMLVDSFLKYISENNLSALLPKVIAHLQRMESESKNENTLKISSKFELSEQEIADIKVVTGALDSKVTQNIDPSIVGGFSASYCGHIYDGSLKNQILQLKKILTK